MKMMGKGMMGKGPMSKGGGTKMRNRNAVGPRSAMAKGMNMGGKGVPMMKKQSRMKMPSDRAGTLSGTARDAMKKGRFGSGAGNMKLKKM